MDRQPALQHWAYPFPGNDRHDPFLYYRALAKARGGHYLIGANGLWHGGVHFDAGTAALLDQSSVRCIADGDVIAYRIDGEYPVSQYGDKQAPYSTGFVLVRHRLEMPVPQDKACTAQPSLTFYSLYMHLQDWAGYQRDGAAEPAAFLAPTCYGIRPDKATDPFLGLRVRAAPPGQPGHERKIALLRKGSRVQVGPAAAPGSGWHRMLAVLDGPATAGEGWVYVPQLSATSEPGVFLAGTQANDNEPTLLPGHGLNVRKNGSGRKDDPITAVLPVGCKVMLEPGNGPYRKLQRIVEGSLPGIRPADIQGYLHVASLQPERATPVLNNVHLLAEPMPIKAGELIGHLGLYQNQDEAQPSPLLHLEVFSCDDVPAFIAQCRQLAHWLPDSEKTLLKIYKGASKLIPHREGLVPDIGMPGATIGVALTVPFSYLEGLPASHRQTTIQHVPGERAGRTTRWWRLDNLLVDEAGQLISGWLADHELITSRHSPWEWEGFNCIDEISRPINRLSLHLDIEQQLSNEEQREYRLQIEQARLSPVHQCLNQAFGAKATISNARSALRNPWDAQAISKLIVRCENEWRWDDGRWSELDTLMCPKPTPSRAHWNTEKERIQKLCWWQEAKMPDKPIWHFQFNSIIRMVPLAAEMKVRAFLRMIKVGEGTSGRSGYERLFGGGSFIKDYGKTFEDHPHIKITSGKLVSSAAGAYQIMSYTWTDPRMKKLREKLKIQDFSPKSQDQFCVAILKYKVRGNPLDKIINGNIKMAIELCSWEWASLPPSRYGQPIVTMDGALKNYEKFLAEEISGNSDLMLEAGFLREL